MSTGAEAHRKGLPPPRKAWRPGCWQPNISRIPSFARACTGLFERTGGECQALVSYGHGNAEMSLRGNMLRAVNTGIR